MRRYLFSTLALVAFLAPAAPAQAAAPDLVILTAVPTGPNTVVVRVRNIGTAASTPCRLALWVHHNPSGTFLGGPYFTSVPALAPGQFASVQITSGVVVNMQRFLRLYIDLGNIVAESNEANNHYTATVP